MGSYSFITSDVLFMHVLRGRHPCISVSEVKHHCLHTGWRIRIASSCIKKCNSAKHSHSFLFRSHVFFTHTHTQASPCQAMPSFPPPRDYLLPFAAFGCVHKAALLCLLFGCIIQATHQRRKVHLFHWIMKRFSFLHV